VRIVIEQLVNGVSIGMVYALIALGYTMVYGILRMINFSHGEVFMVGGFAGWLVITGLLGLPGSPVPGLVIVIAALGIAMAVCAALGYGIERFAYRPLRNARSMGVIISGLGVSLFLQTAAILVFGARFKIVETGRLIPNWWAVSIGPVTVPFVRVLIVVVALGLMVGLEYFVHRTRWGRATRATAQDLEAAAFMGVDVDRVVSLVYMIGSALAGVGGVLVALLFTQVDFAFGFFIGIKAFTSAVIGGIGNIRGALLGGLALGIVESVATGFISPTYKDVITFVLLAGVLLLRPTGLLGRPLRVREAVATTAPGVRSRAWLVALLAPLGTAGGFLARIDGRIWLAAGVVAVLLVPQVVEQPYLVRVAASIGLAVVLTASLNVVAGWAGLLSLGHVGFYAVGAYVYAFLASPHFGVHLPFLLAMASAGVAAGVFGLLIGTVSLRLRGDYLAMVTLAFAEIVRNLLISLDRPINLTGGSNGILNLDVPALAGVAIRELADFYYLIWVFALLALGALARLRQSKVGRAWLAIREDEVAAGNMGVPVFPYKLLAFIVAAVLAAMTGSVFAAWQGSVFPESFTIQQTAILYAMLVVSGAAGMPGIVVGATALTVLPEWLREYGVYRMLLLGALLVLVMRYRPQGFFAAVPRRSAAPAVEDAPEVGRARVGAR
jgi:ABC-type branched-subunit amino acid transport system permease subunit